SAPVNKVSRPSASDLAHSSSLSARRLRNTNILPSGDKPGCNASIPATVSGCDVPVVFPAIGSNGTVQRRLLSLRILNANFRPSEDTAMSVSLPAPVVMRSSPSIQRSVDGTTFTFQRFLTPCDSPSKIKPFAEGSQRKLT